MPVRTGRKHTLAALLTVILALLLRAVERLFDLDFAVCSLWLGLRIPLIEPLVIREILPPPNDVLLRQVRPVEIQGDPPIVAPLSVVNLVYPLGAKLFRPRLGPPAQPHHHLPPRALVLRHFGLVLILRVARGARLLAGEGCR